MGAIKNYIRAAIKTLDKQNTRIQERQEFSDKVLQEKLDKLLDVFISGKITEEEYTELSTDLLFAHVFGDGYFFDELHRREGEQNKNLENHEKIPTDELGELAPLDVLKLTNDLIEKKGLFEDEKK